MVPRNQTQIISYVASLPSHYGFVQKGDPYKTRWCRKLTHEAREVLYIIENNRKYREGLGAPHRIIDEVNRMDVETKARRQAAVGRRDKALKEELEAVIIERFPHMSARMFEVISKRSLTKGAGRNRSVHLRRKPKDRWPGWMEFEVDLVVKRYVRCWYSNPAKKLAEMRSGVN